MKPLRSLYAFYVAILVGFFRMEDDIEITKQKKKKKNCKGNVFFPEFF